MKQDDNIPSLTFVKKITGCNICGGKLVFIRGKYPNEEQREICPTCAYERLEQIRIISDADYGKAYCSNDNYKNNNEQK